MIFNMFLIHNKVIKAFERPIFTQDNDEEFVERIVRDFRASDEVSKAKMLECSVISIGVFDDNTGKITLHDPVPVFDLGSLKDPVVEVNKDD